MKIAFLGTARTVTGSQHLLVHGEDGPAQALQEKLQEAGMDRVMYPYPRQTVEI